MDFISGIKNYILNVLRSLQIHTGSQGATGQAVVFCPAWRTFSVTTFISGSVARFVVWRHLVVDLCRTWIRETTQRGCHWHTHTGLFWVQCELQISVCSRCFFHHRATTLLRVEWVTPLLYSASMTCSHPQYEALDWVWRRGTHRFHVQTKTQSDRNQKIIRNHFFFSITTIPGAVIDPWG